MNFDEMKNMLNEDGDDFMIPNSLEDIKESQLPIRRIRQIMMWEIVVQVFCIIFFLLVPLVIPMYPLPRAVYYIFIFHLSLIGLTQYLWKMFSFLRKTTHTLGSTTRDAIVTFVHELKITLAVYKTSVITTSLLLPLPVLALYFGDTRYRGGEVFAQWFLLDISPLQILYLVLGFLGFGIFIYLVTIASMRLMYGGHLKKLEQLLEQLEE